MDRRGEALGSELTLSLTFLESTDGDASSAGSSVTVPGDSSLSPGSHRKVGGECRLYNVVL